MRIFLFSLLLAFTGPAQALEYEVRPSVALQGHADQSKTARKLTGGLLMGLGALTTTLLLDDDDQTTEDDITAGEAIFAGGVLVGLGALPFFIESRPERAWNSVQQIADSSEREQIAYSSLIDLADQYRYARLLGGTLNLAVATFFLSQPTEREYNEYGYKEYDYTFNAIIHGVVGAYSLIVPSRAERIVKRYKSGEYRKDFAGSGFSVGLSGSLRYPGLALRYTF